ncbi:Glutamate decarboxylase [Hibiscus syriacus]|uniref:glutamate decarboxylase n=1 Tax=Hibiscus syriacus TaxID=106335 RepID=A0A6A3B0E2_HIBSY|nr:Glutamate decarboxylase [Hibiscus syriacus]
MVNNLHVKRRRLQCDDNNLLSTTMVGSSQIIVQYYQLIRLGLEGYKNIMENCIDNARPLKEGIESTGRFEVVSKDVGVPLVAFALKDSSKYTVFQISDSLKKFGWIVPAYTMPADAQHIAFLRVVVREDFGRSLAERLISHIEEVLKELDSQPSHIIVKDSHVGAVAEAVAEGNKGGEAGERAERMIQEKVTKQWRHFVEIKRVGVLKRLRIYVLPYYLQP